MANAIAEQHSIDFIPLTERYGSPWRLFTLWFSLNLHILGVAIGALFVAEGLSITEAIGALVLGNLIGTFVMAAHSAQGPQLGIPQMIQSRAQFGVLGAALPLVAVVVAYVLFTAADLLIMQGTMKSLLSVNSDTALLLVALATLVVAYFGYELIHSIGKLMTVLSTVLFAVATVLVFIHPAVAAPAQIPVVGRGGHAAFILVLTQSAAWSLSYGPYVADYSRYLPADVSPWKTFWATMAGCFIGSSAIMAFGVVLAHRMLAPGADLAKSFTSLFGPLRPMAQFMLIFGIIYGNGLNVYSAYMSSCTVVSGFNRMTQAGRGFKITLMILVMAAAVFTSFLSQGNFQGYFGNVLNIMIYLLVPWSAINLADFYFIRHGHYDIGAMFQLHGIYGAYRWRTIAVYVLSVIAEIPFMSLSFYKGAVTQWIGADIAWLPGLVVSAGCYVLAERGRSMVAAVESNEISAAVPDASRYDC